MVRLKKISRIVLLVVSLISVFFAFQASTVTFDYDFEAFFADNDPDTRFFEEHRQRFETDNDFIFIAIENDGKSIFDTTFLQKISRLTDALAEDTLIDQVQSLTHMKDYVKAPFSPAVLSRPYLSIDRPEKLAADSVRIFERREVANFFVRKDGKAIMLFVKHRPYLSKANCDVLNASIDRILADHSITHFKYAGRAIGIGFYVDAMQFETAFFIGLSFILITIFLILSFRSVWGLLIPLSIVTFSMLWIVGFMGTMGQPINMVLTVLPSIIFVVAMSDVIHLVSKYFDELRLGRSQEDAVKIAYREIGFATLLTSVTTAVGFLTLLTVGMRPVQSFGIYVALGVLFAFVLAYTMLPALLLLTRPPKIAQKSFTSNMWYPYLHKGFAFVLKKYKVLAVVFAGVLLICIGGVFKVESNYYLLEDLKEESELRKDYHYFDQEFMGLRPFEMAVFVKDSSKSIYDYAVLAELNKIDQFLEADYGLKQCASVVQVLKIANRTEHGGRIDYYAFPEEKEAKRYLKQINRFDKDGMLSLFVDSTETYARFSSTIGDVGRYAINEKNERLATFFESEIDHNLIDYRLTGTGHLLDKNMGSLSSNLTMGLLLAVCIVSLLMGFLYRSIKIVLIALVPNVLPLLMLAAILGYCGIQLKVSTAIIFTISFGIAVDDTIHFMSKFKLELGKGKSFLYALKRTYLSTGRAIILTTLILCSGFLLLMFSDFLGTFYIGLLISCTLFFALIADLFFLPVLLIIFYGKKKR